MELTPDQIAEIAKQTAAVMQQQAQPTATQPTTTTTLATDPVAQAAQAAQGAVAGAPGLEAFQTMIETALAKQAQTANASITTDLFNERMTGLQQSNPALHEFLQGDDEFGQPRMNRINSITDYAEKMQALQTVSQNFGAAQVQSVQGSPQSVIPKAVQAQADKTNKQYEEINVKLEEGDMSPEEHTKAFFDNLNVEVIDQVAERM